MKNFPFISLLVIVFVIPATKLYSQLCDGRPYSCQAHDPVVNINGKASAPWAIDGSVDDWKTILGPSRHDPSLPFCPPWGYSSNWSLEGFLKPDLDTPDSTRNLQFSAFIRDDYNVYFYFRRLKVGTTQSTFYYFFDVNADGYLNYGEPVIYAVFSRNYISALTISRYIPDKSKFYIEGKGNNMVSPDYQTQEFLRVDKFPLRGRLVKLFSADSIPSNQQLSNKEIFSAAITENGHGVEFAVPWKYLKNWIVVNALQSKSNTIFTYKISVQKGIGKYEAEKIVDNMGNCCNSFVTSGSVKLRDSISATEIVPGSSYRFKIYYTNPTNVAEVVGIEKISMSNLQLNSEGPIQKDDFNAKIYADNNCSGTVNQGEDSISYFAEYSKGHSILHNDGNVYMTPKDGHDGTSVTVPAFGTSCFITDIFIPHNSFLISGSFLFQSSVEFDLIVEWCHAGGKVINPVGNAKTKIGNHGFTFGSSGDSIRIAGVTNADVTIYPNPNTGSFNIYLKGGDNNKLILYDIYGRTVQQQSSDNAKIVEMHNLVAGTYFLKVVFKNGRTITKKIVVE